MVIEAPAGLDKTRSNTHSVAPPGQQISIAVNVSTRLLPRCGRGMDKIKMNQITRRSLNS
jgi:hypothetical protein